ncbi:GyrI-like domain-containing protein [Paenibacillus planticolens]|uniref:AraC family transcriptional regulator n=1 Tax=Paenibacillus planticolens TaxID=2654976 RepID=A0ABX1ZF46_9BACL|nr:GyrI-like domain-containing protein [Paenibacillus planticolens]NOU98696.1 AraC family transcriptional regulator [Paenibacillus planticolens]
MQTFITEQPAITLTGVHVRTTNADEAGPNRRLPQLWETYFQSQITSQTSTINSHLIYALYTEYESDAAGAYTTLIGHEATGDKSQNEDKFHTAQVPASKYLVFTAEKGPVYEVVAQAWGTIWAYFKESGEVRTFTGDYELYDTRNWDPAETQIQIFIAIK